MGRLGDRFVVGAEGSSRFVRAIPVAEDHDDRHSRRHRESFQSTLSPQVEDLLPGSAPFEPGPALFKDRISDLVRQLLVLGTKLPPRVCLATEKLSQPLSDFAVVVVDEIWKDHLPLSPAQQPCLLDGHAEVDREEPVEVEANRGIGSAPGGNLWPIWKLITWTTPGSADRLNVCLRFRNPASLRRG